ADFQHASNLAETLFNLAIGEFKAHVFARGIKIPRVGDAIDLFQAVVVVVIGYSLQPVLQPFTPQYAFHFFLGFLNHKFHGAFPYVRRLSRARWVWWLAISLTKGCYIF